MAEKKYSSNIINGPFSTEDNAVFSGKSILAHNNEYGSGVSLSYQCISKAGDMGVKPHTHDFHQLLCFMGGNPEDIHDFGAEFCVYLGAEKEEHLINGPTIVSIPAGMVHRIGDVVRCDKPVVMLEISTTEKYEVKEQ